jgi:hypothetical protein
VIGLMDGGWDCEEENIGEIEMGLSSGEALETTTGALGLRGS